MSTLLQRKRASLSIERQFFGAMALLILALTFIGFAPSYYLAPVFGAKPLSFLLHVHGVVFTLWILLYSVQTALVSAGRSDIHRFVGPMALVVAVAMVPLGIVTAIVTERISAARHLPPQGPPLIFPLGAILTFAVLIGAAFAMRTRSSWHKRLMLLGTMAILTTPLARITRFTHMGLTPALGGMVLTDILLAALVIYDLKSLGRMHPATMWGGGFFVATQALRLLLNLSPMWQAFAKTLTG